MRVVRARGDHARGRRRAAHAAAAEGPLLHRQQRDLASRRARLQAAGEDAGCEIPLKDARAALFAAVDRANLTVHAIDPQGLVQRRTADTGLDPESGRCPNKTAATTRLEQQQVETNDLLTGQQNLRVLPDRTGGRTVVGRNNPEETVPDDLPRERGVLRARRRAGHVRPAGQRALDRSQGRTQRASRVCAAAIRRAVSTQCVCRRAGVGSAVVQPGTHSAGCSRVPDCRSRWRSRAFASPDSAKPIVRLNVDTGAFARSDGSAVPLDITVMATDQTGRPVASARQTSTITGARLASRTPADVKVQPRRDQRAVAAGARPGRLRTPRGGVGRGHGQGGQRVLRRHRPEVRQRAALAVGRDASTSRARPRSRRWRRRDECFGGRSRSVRCCRSTRAPGAPRPIVPVSMRVQILDAKGGAVRDQSLPFTEQTFTNRRADCVITLPVAKLPAGEYSAEAGGVGGSTHRTGRALRFAVE